MSSGAIHSGGAMIVQPAAAAAARPPTQEAPLATAELDITGMHCGACATRIERTLARLPAVASASVNLATTRAFVAYDASSIDVDKLCATVEASGYHAEPMIRGGPAAPSGHADHWVVRAAVAWPLAVAALTVSLLAAQSPGPAWTVLALAVAVELIGGWPFLRDAARQAWRRTTSMDTLVGLGTVSAVAVNAVYVIALGGRHIHVGSAGSDLATRLHFAMAPLIVSVLATGRAVEGAARRRAASALHSLLSLRPPTARVVKDPADDGGELVSPESVPVGALLRVRPDETVPLDGTVVAGYSAVDESMLTGEPMPVERGPGSAVIGGTRNGPGVLVVRVNAPAQESVLARLDQMVDDAQRDKPPLQKLADRVSSVFVPAVLAGAAVTFVVWWFAVGNHDQAVLATLAVLLVACPCAMGLAAPVAMMVGSGRAAALGIVVRGGDVLERLARADTVAFDKTGTLTERGAQVTDVHPLPGTDRDGVLSLAAAVEADIDHPIAHAVCAAAGSHPHAVGVKSLPGAGVAGLVDAVPVRVGRLRPQAVPVALEDWARQRWERGETTVVVEHAGAVVGGIAVSALLRPEATDSVRRLHQLGLKTVVLSGDSEPAVTTVAHTVGVEQARSALSPADKVDAVRSLGVSGRRVMMVGDGVNDAPALAAADVGCVIGDAAEAALATSDVALLGNDLRGVPGAVALARATLTIVRENFAWAAGYNVAALPLAALGLIDPLVAAAAMALSSLLVVANSLRLSRLGRGGLGSLRASSAPRTGRHLAASMLLPVVLFAGVTLATQAVSPARGESLLPALPTITTVSFEAQGQAQLYLNPSAPGLNELHLYLFPARVGAPIEDVRVSAGRAGHPLQLVRSVRVGPDHYVQYVLLSAGTWTFRVTLRIAGHVESFRLSRIVP